MTPEVFPILAWSRRNRPDCPASVPWSLVAGHEQQAQVNHGQSFARLAMRGGLSPAELWAVVHDLPWEMAQNENAAIEWLKALVQP